jgi:hypothetical protein
MKKTEEAITDAETVRRSAHAEQVELISCFPTMAKATFGARSGTADEGISR